MQSGNLPKQLESWLAGLHRSRKDGPKRFLEFFWSGLTAARFKHSSLGKITRDNSPRNDCASVHSPYLTAIKSLSLSTAETRFSGFRNHHDRRMFQFAVQRNCVEPLQHIVEVADDIYLVLLLHLRGDHRRCEE